MAPKPKKTSPTWSDVKSKMAEFDRAGLLGTIQDLYAASKDTQAFLHARFGLGPDVLDPYKATIARSLWPDLTRSQLPSELNPLGETVNYGQLGCVIALGCCAATQGWLDSNSTGDR